MYKVDWVRGICHLNSFLKQTFLDLISNISSGDSSNLDDIMFDNGFADGFL